MENKEYVRRLAKFLAMNKTTMTAEHLAQHLNWNGFETSYGDEYAGGRGTYRLIHTTYDWLVLIDQQDDADCVASAFTKPDGSFAYDK